MTKITGFDTFDVRFPTSRTLAGSDAMNPAPDYSAAYVAIRTDAADPALSGHGFAPRRVPMRFRRRPGVAPLGPSRAITAALAAWPPSR
jgi:hypothetical protein